MKIAILDDYQDVVKTLPCFSLLNEHAVTVFSTPPQSEVELIERLADQDGVVLIRERTVVHASLLEQLPALKIISQTGSLSNHLDLKVCSKYGVAVAEGIGSPVSTAELCWALILTASRHIIPYVVNLKQGLWQDSGSLGLGRTLNGLTLGIWGYGKIGQRIARFGEAFGMNVLVWGSESSRKRAVSHGFAAATSKADFFSAADVLTLHLRLNPATRGCVSYEDLQLMKKDALLVNTSRAALIESQALYRSLLAGRPGYAALDVYEQEPVLAGQELLLNLPNVLGSPHLGYVEQKSYELYFKIAFENIINFFNGQPQNIANPDVLPESER